MEIRRWLDEQLKSEKKTAMPVLSFPGIQLLNISVKELISDSDTQAKGMKAVSDRCKTSATVSMMDLSVEAEAFGAKIKISDDEVPTVIGRAVETPSDAEKLKVPSVNAGRCGLYVEAIGKAVKLITDRPVFAGVIGPFSLAGRLMDMSEIMINCYEEPEAVHTVLEKVTAFLIQYMLEYKKAGAHGVVVAEPAAGLLSPSICDEFSSAYMRRIVREVQAKDFSVIYHNCGNTIPLVRSLLSFDADAYHFGNAIDIGEILKLFPKDKLVMGNVSPSEYFRNGSPESVYAKTTELLKSNSHYKNFIISSGCDIPPMTPWQNIDAFFKAVEDFYN